MKLPFNRLRRGRSDFALRNSSSYYRRLPLEPLEERRLLAAGEFLGPNLVFNGSFDDDEGGSDDLTGWITDRGGVQWEIEGGDGVARITSLHGGSVIDPNVPTGAAAARMRQGVLVSPNTTYRLEFDLNTRRVVTNSSSTDIKLQVLEGDPTGAVSFLFQQEYKDIDNGRQFVEIVTGANVDDDTITFQFIATNSQRDFTIDNVSMRALIDVPVDGGQGPELFSNGTFDQADQLTGWAFPNGGVEWKLESSAYDDGAARVTSVNSDPNAPDGASNAKIRQTIDTDPDTTYRLQFDLISKQLTGGSGTNIKLQFLEGNGTTGLLFDALVFSGSDNGPNIVEFNTGPADDEITIQFLANKSARDFTIDNVSVREAISIPREVGVELLANGSFDTAGGGFDSLAGWTTDGDPGTVTLDNGAARVNGTTGDASIEQTVRTVKNAIHLVSFELNVATGQARVQVLDGTGGVLANDVLGSGQHSFEVTSVDKFLTVRAQASAGGNFTIDDVSVQITELPPDPNIGNFIINGSFDEDGGGSNNLANWDFPNGGVLWEIEGLDDGFARVTSLHPGTLIDENTPDGAANAKIRQTVPTNTNTTYRLEFDFISRRVVTEISKTNIKLQVIRGGPGSLLLAETLDKNDNGHQAFDLFTEGETSIIVQFFASSTARDFWIDNVTLREIDPKLVDVSSFEVGEGFSEGLLDGQGGWTSMVDPGEGPISPFISRENPNSGSQHIRIEKNFALPVADSDNPGPFNGAISGEITDVDGGVFASSIDVFISDRNGADYDVVAQASSQNDVTWQIRFESNGTIRAADDLGRGRELVDTGASWTPGVYRTLQVVVDSAKNRISYEYNGTEIYSTSGNGGVFGADVVEEIILKSNNAHIGDYADFDNLTITNLSGGEPEKADLARAVPTGWDDTIVLSTEAGTNSDATIIEPGQDIFVDLAMSNIGLADTGEFSVQLMIDGAPFGNPQVVLGPLSPLGTATFEDINIGPRSAGSHTISLVIDSGGIVIESDETNNSYARVFSVGTTDEVGLIAAAPFNRIGPLGGLISVSEGTSGRINTAGDSDDVSFMAQVGETIAAMVTPTSSTARLTIQLVGAAGTFTGAPGASVVLPARAVASTGAHTLRISGDAATDYVVKLVRNAGIEGADSGNGSELSLGGSSTVAGSAVLAMTHSGADVDEFTIDLTGKTGNRIDVVLAGVAADFSGGTLELLGTNGTTVLATGTASPQGSNATNFDLAIQDFEVPAGGVYTIRVSSTQATNAEYTLRVTDTETELGASTVLESEPNDDQNAAAGLRRLNNDVDNINSVLGFLSAETSEIRRLFAVDSSTDEIVELDPDSGAEINRFSLPTPGAAGAAGLAFDGSSLFYASGEPGQRTLYEINPDTETVIDSDTFASIGLGDGIGSLGIVDGRLAALDGLTDQVMLVDTTTDRVIGSLDLLASGSSAASLFAFTGDGLTGADSRGSVFVWGLRLDSSLSVAIIEFDATDGSLLGSFDAPSDNGVPGLAFIGDQLFALDSTNTVFKLDPDTGTTLDSYSLDVAPDTWITALGADAGTAAVGGDTFTVFLTAGQTLTVDTDTPLDSSTVGPVNSLDPRLVIFDPSGSQVGADSNSDDGKNALVVVTAATTGLYRIQVLAESGQGEYRLNASTDPVLALSIIDVFPDPRNTVVGSIDMKFNMAVTGFALEDIRLTRNGGGNLLPGGTSLSFDGTTYTLNGLAGLTGADGEYELSVSDTGAPIQAAGELLAAADVEQWTMDTVAPVLTVDTLSTEDGSPALTGTVDDASLSVDVTVDGSMYQANVAGNGVWTVPAGTIAPDLATGTYEVIASAKDAAGNTGSDNTNNELTITGGLPADLTGNGFVDFQDLTILLANWNKNVSAAAGNLVNPGTTPVDFQDLTVLLAAWTGPGPAGAAGANAVAADVAVTEMTGSSEVSSTSRDSTAEGEVSLAQPRRRTERTAARRRLRATAVDVALGGGELDVLAWRARHGRSHARRVGR